MLHMASHTDMQIGRYAAAVATGRRAVAADRAHADELNEPGAYAQHVESALSFFGRRRPTARSCHS